MIKFDTRLENVSIFLEIDEGLKSIQFVQFDRIQLSVKKEELLCWSNITDWLIVEQIINRQTDYLLQIYAISLACVYPRTFLYYQIA